jgi:hypothetical protein
LTFVGTCRDNVEGVTGLDGPWAVTASPDGAHLYVAGRVNDALVVLAQPPTPAAFLPLIETR